MSRSQGTDPASRPPCAPIAPNLHHRVCHPGKVLVVRVLGPVEVERDGEIRRIGSPKQRLLVALLAAHQGSVSRPHLVDALWGDEPPVSASATLMGYVSRLRAALGSQVITSGATGYSLRADRIDAHEFESLLQGRSDAASLEHALALWGGDAFGEFSEHRFLVTHVRRLHELRTSARIRLASALFDDGETARPVSMLEALIADEPLREDAWVLLVRVLLAAGRSADAVRAAYRCRRQLAGIGLEPTAELAAAEGEALQQRGSAASDRSAPEVDIGPVRYARNGGVHLAYQVAGGGPVDLIFSSYGSVSVDSIWDNQQFSSFITRLAASCRVVLYDTRGIGLSDPTDVESPPSLAQQSGDLHAVIDGAVANRVVIVAVGDGGPTAITYAHRNPPELIGLVLINTFARLVEAPDYPGVPRDRFDANITMSTDPDTGRDTSLVLRNHAPSVAADPVFRRWWDRAGRRGASPATATALWRIRYGADVRSLLNTLDTPALVLHRRHTRVVPIQHGAFLAAHIPGARLVELDGADQPPFTEGGDDIADCVTNFAMALTQGTRAPN